MAWTLCQVPTSASNVSGPAVYLSKSRALRITEAAWKLAGLNPHDPLLMERDGERFRVRRCGEGEPVFGILSKPASETSAVFSTGGKVLSSLGCASARCVCSCGDGWIEFDAKAMFDAGRTDSALTKAIAQQVSAPAVKASPEDAAVKPWSLRIHPDNAMNAVRLMVKRVEYPTVAREVGIEPNDVLAVRHMVGDAKLAVLRKASDLEREEYYGKALVRWRQRWEVRRNQPQEEEA